jgi:peptide/nickel transport system ATP-binding protein
MKSPAPILDVRGLSVTFRTVGRTVHALDDVSLRTERGEVLGVVGESGCGKSTLAMSVMGLLPEAAEIRSGGIRLGDRDLLTLDRRQMQRVRGRHIGMIFQEPMTSLNPSMPVGRQITEVLRRHRPLSRAAARTTAIDLLDLVGIPDPKRRSAAYPHQLSGGQRQRVVIAIAIACEPELLIADEPTTALDVTVQAQILDLLRRLRDEVGIAIMLITHNLGVIAHMADRVAIMYAGRKIEQGKTADILNAPRHPYTARLLAAVPQTSRLGGIATRRLTEIPGRVPVLTAPAASCTFAPRCHRSIPACTQHRPELQTVNPGGETACFNPEETW